MKKNNKSIDHKTLFNILQKRYPDGYTKEQKESVKNQLIKGKKVEAKESTGSDGSGGYESLATKTTIKRPIGTIHNFNTKEEEIKEVTDSSSSGAYDTPFPGFGSKDPLSIGGEKTIRQRMNTIRSKKFPMWVKGGTFVEVKPKCKKFPYCNQGDIHALNFYRGTISEIANKYGLTKSEIISIIMENIDIY